jgi:hypothetical protein
MDGEGRSVVQREAQDEEQAMKKKPAKKAKRKAREWDLAIDDSGAIIVIDPWCSVDMGYAKWVRVREVLPRTRTRKGER